VKRRALAALAGVTLASATAAADPPPRPDPPSPIYGGRETVGRERDAIVAILYGQAICTGTVVAPRLVLTAAHCLVDLPEGALPAVYEGPIVTVGRTIPVVGFGVDPRFCRACDEGVHDFGYVELGEDFAPEGGYIRPVADPALWDRAVRVGAKVTLVGYGKSDDAIDPYEGAGQKREVESEILAFAREGLEYYAGGNGRSTCEGDSGGPALVVDETGAPRLAGILSRGSSPCGHGSFYGAAIDSLCWVRDATGTDLVPASCGGCDCIERATDEGCALGGPARASLPAVTASLLLALSAAARRRARS
jgi:V8-like Glu-specific endopeptidase